ncbi:MAG: hypothetical protein REI78_16095 [Pedobacter sp.]|nr:hypothetical protein [Pedobacter sp.]MDQ8054552.1 hypothetical protein [Pedobacter sp.]
MKTIVTYFFASALLFTGLNAAAQGVDPKFAAIHKQFYLQFPKTITFVQKTENYRADTLFRTQTWYEAGSLPNLFRIDIGDPKDGNAVIYRGDSTYNFRKGKLARATVDPNILVYLLGGMYFQTIDQVQQKMKTDGFDLSKSYHTKWNGRDVDVFGTATADSTKSQLWYDSREHYLVRMMQQTPESHLECHFSQHQKTGKVWHEGYVKILVNHKLVQTETYSDFKINVQLDPSFFEPSKFGTWHWLK